MSFEKEIHIEPCPFCGSEKVKVDTKSTLAGHTGIDERVKQVTASVRCNVCHARGPAIGGKVVVGRHSGKIPDWATTEDALYIEAVKKWNSR